ncbi:polysaccharide deacetylase family protein [Romboutsia lituseburensis]|uniref:polysaccharide deacetylase family protein n=1 Tax=Romboutsia lituseburensis TaxID=1537 RepID=UPI00215AA703|nr:polysaccharide deacetylase family protein [Romboutsia lituseburensis]MCR8746892.1 polysaccharide deacetylase family protein [Romboutsia lituseburensis]
MIKLFIWIITIIIVILLIYSILPTLYYRIFKIHAPKHPNNKNSILLSFDDGPSKDYTNMFLDLLKKYNIQATFFIVAKEADKNQDIIKRIVLEGHTLGLHSLEHKSALVKGYLYTKYDFDESIKIIKKLGYNIKYYRPPWGEVNLFTLYYVKKYNLNLVLWNVMLGDWSRYTNIDKIINRLLLRVGNRSVICLHDGRGSAGAPLMTITALETVIPELIKKGFNFKNINEFY